MARVVVVGAGMAGLIAAYCAIRDGHSVTVLEASRPGGAVQHEVMQLDGEQLTFDVGAEAYAARSALLDELVTELGLADDVVTPNPAGSWLYLPDVGAVLAPKLGMWGIPGDPHADEVLAAVGPAAAARAAQELVTPMDPWIARHKAGESITVGALVADRFGPVVLARLVAPVVAGVHSADPYALDIDRIAPGLVDRAITHGSVAKAIADQRAAAPPGAAVKSLRGGMATLQQALVAYVRDHGQLHSPAKVSALDARARAVVMADGTRHAADHVVLAVDAPTAHDLLATITPSVQRPTLSHRPEYGAGVQLVMIVLDHPALDDAPRGTGMLVAPEVTEVAAKAATHVTAKWPWARDTAVQQHPHRHVVRLSYGRITDPPDGSAPGYATSEAALRRMAVRDLAALFGLDEQQVADSVAAMTTVRWREAMPLTTPDNAQRTAAIQRATDQYDWLHVTGAWFAGTGLAAIAQHATTLKLHPLQ